MRIQSFLLGIILTLIITYNGCEGKDSSSCKSLENHSPVLRLKRYLFCDYDQSVRPTSSQKNATVVRFKLTVQSFKVYQYSSTVELQCLTFLGWNDFHLTWKPSSFDDIKWFQAKSHEIWVPDVMVHSVTNFEESFDMPTTLCWVGHNGEVYCVPSRVYGTHCIMDYTWWPYDVINCTIQFGMWSYGNEEIEFLLTTSVVEGQLTNTSEKNSEWDIVRFYSTQRVEPSKFGTNFESTLISYHLILKRHASMHDIGYIVPIIVLMVFTLLTLWLEPMSMERMMLANMNFIFHLLCIDNLQWDIYYSTNSPPKLFYLYDKSFLMATITLLLTSILRYVEELKIKLPAWILSSTVSIVRSKVGQILLMTIMDPKVSAKIEIDMDDNADLVSSNKKASPWRYVTILVGWIAFLSALIAYIVILATHLPTSTSGNTYMLDT